MSETVTLTRLTPLLKQLKIEVPRHIGAIRLVREIGRGGMGCVWLGQDEMLHREVAVKFLTELGGQTDAAEQHRFIEGARAATAVRHVNLVQVFQCDLIVDLPFLVMEYVAGWSLSDAIRVLGTLSFAEAVAVAKDICAGVGALHTEGIVHRDIKPANILLGRDLAVRVTDFGLTLRTGHSNPFVRLPEAAGTPTFMPSEAHEGVVSPRTDVYGIGKVLAAMLGGAKSVERGDSELIDSLPPELRPIVERAIHPNPLLRYKTAVNLRDALCAIPVSALDDREALDSLVGRLSRSTDRCKKAKPIPEESTEAVGFQDCIASAASKKRALRLQQVEANLNVLQGEQNANTARARNLTADILFRRFPELHEFRTRERLARAIREIVELEPETRSWFRIGTKGYLVLGVLSLAVYFFRLWWVPATAGQRDWILTRSLLLLLGVFAVIAWRLTVGRQDAAHRIREHLIDDGVFVCVNCGYDLRGQKVWRCPECGRCYTLKCFRVSLAFSDDNNSFRVEKFVHGPNRDFSQSVVRASSGVKDAPQSSVWKIVEMGDAPDGATAGVVVDASSLQAYNPRK